MTLYYLERNLNNIAKLADNTKALALKWHEYLVKNDINILIYETIRTEAKQREYVNSGASQTMRSYHLVGQALDFVPVNSKGKTLWNGYGAADVKKPLKKLSALVLSGAEIGEVLLISHTFNIIIKVMVQILLMGQR